MRGKEERVPLQDLQPNFLEKSLIKNTRERVPLPGFEPGFQALCIAKLTKLALSYRKLASYPS